MQRFIRQELIFTINIRRSLPCINLHPGNSPGISIGFLDCRIDDVEHDRSNIDANAVTLK